MTIRTLLVSLSAATVALLTSVACEIHTCEEGATCREDDWDDDDHARAECTTYCGRLSVCGAKQARDFEACVDSCRDRYERLPEETHRLCSCAPVSSCGDVIEGRCTPPGNDGSGGTCNACNSGGAPNGNPNGGGAATDATSASGGSTAGLGGTGAAPSSGGTGAAPSSAGNGTAGEPGMSCVASCDCPSGQSCVSGYCTL